MVELELVAGDLVALGVRKLSRVGDRLDKEADAALDAGLDRLHGASAAKLVADPALEKLDADVSQELEPSEWMLRGVRNAIMDAAEDDSDFAATIGGLVARLEEVLDGAQSVAGVDLRGPKGVQLGSFNTQTNTF